MQVLLLGAGGMLGHDLIVSKPAEIVLHPCTRAQVDITDAWQVQHAISHCEADLVVNAAAYTDVDEAERDPDTAFAINAVAPGEIGRAAAQVGARVVHYSTDYIFDGRAKSPYQEQDPPNPLSVYGASKLRGDKNLEMSGAEYLIIRTQWLFGLHGRSFPRTMWERAISRLSTRVVVDRVGRPTYTVDLARVTWELAAAGVSGIVHAANASTGSWYDVARRIYAAANAEELLEPCSHAEYPAAASRPAWSVLDTAKLDGLIGRPLPTWQNAIDRFLLEIRDSPQLPSPRDLCKP